MSLPVTLAVPPPSCHPPCLRLRRPPSCQPPVTLARPPCLSPPVSLQRPSSNLPFHPCSARVRECVGVCLSTCASACACVCVCGVCVRVCVVACVCEWCVRVRVLPTTCMAHRTAARLSAVWSVLITPMSPRAKYKFSCQPHVIVCSACSLNVDYNNHSRVIGNGDDGIFDGNLMG